jgi:hypothetical protein
MSCTGYPINLTLEPSLVRSGDEVVLTYDLTDNFPEACTITGTGITGTPGAFGTFEPTCTVGTNPDGSPNYSDCRAAATGEITITVDGPHVYTAQCGDTTERVQVNILSSVFET